MLGLLTGSLRSVCPAPVLASMVDSEQKYVVVDGGQRVTDGLSEAEARKKAEELKRQLEESSPATPREVKVVPLVFG